MNNLDREEQEVGKEPSLKEQIEYITFFRQDIGAFYVSFFPQLDMSTEEQNEFLDQINEGKLFDEYYSLLVEAYGGEENLQKVVFVMNTFYDSCAQAFEVVPKELDRWLGENRDVKLH
jgi:hypothetical protein